MKMLTDCVQSDASNASQLKRKGGVVMDEYTFKKLNQVIKQLISDGKRKFAIYPFGKRGLELKELLNTRYGIEECGIIDNELSKLNDNGMIISVEEIQNKLDDDVLILLASDNPDSYNIIREQIYRVLPFERVIDVLSRSLVHDPLMYNVQPEWQKPRIGTLEMAAREIIRNNVEGSLAEVGVFKGDFSKEIVKLLPNRKMYLFDTFEGFDERDIEKNDQYIIDFQNDEETFKDTSVEMAVNNIGRYNYLEVRKGYFPETTQGLENEKFAFVSLDTDLYKPIKAGLEFFWYKMSRGGYIFVHDYTWGRVGDAVREFAKEYHTGYVPITDYCHSVIFVKSY